MLLQIIIKEVLEHFKSLRFILSFVMVVALFVVSAILFIPEYRQQMNDFDRNRNEMFSRLSQRAQQQGALFSVFSFNYDGPWVYKRPDHLSFISEGHERNLPNAFQPSAFRVYGPSKQVRSNILLWPGEVMDWSLIISIILSFVALILVYDGISGEREHGTLSVMLSNSISRPTVLFGKFLGALLCLGLALMVGILMNLIIITGGGGIAFASLDWIVILFSFILSLLYVSLFLLFGLFISSHTRESATTMVVSLLCWALLVIVIPRSGGFIATRIMKLPTWSKAQSDAYRSEEETKKSYDEKNPNVAKAGSSGHWSPGEPLERALVMSDAWSKVFDDYRSKMINQVELARKATMISPFASFSIGIETLTESGITHYKEFFRQIQDYRLVMRQHLLDIYSFPLKWHRWDPNQQTEEYKAKFEQMFKPLDVNTIPQFEEKRLDLKILLNLTLPYLLFLVLFNVLLFAGAFVSFLRYDVR